jgi:VanZ family protein
MSNNFQRPHRLNWPDMPMPTARMACIGYGLLIIYASLFPFNFNFGVGAELLDWMIAPIPKYITSFDIFTNILGYIPLGFLLVFAVYPLLKDYKALLFSLVVGLTVSACMESLQTWLATRIPSNVDWWANILGCGIGALLALPLGPRWLSGTAFEHKRHDWFGRRSSTVLLLFSFPFAQIYPQSAWLAMGDWGSVLTNEAIWSAPINYMGLEMATTAFAWLAAALTLGLGMRDHAPKIFIITYLLAITMILKALFNGLQFGIDRAFIWLTPAAFWGMIFSGTLLIGLFELSRRWLYVMAITAFIVMLLLVNFFPQNPYYLVSLQEWQQGRLIHFNHMMSWLSWLWPIGAGLSLLKGLKIR